VPVIVPPPPRAPTALPTVVAPDTSKQSASSTAGIISDRISSIVTGFGGGNVSAGSSPTANATCGPTLAMGEQTGISAGDNGAVVNGVWGSGSVTSVRKTDQGGDYAGNIANSVVGYDRRVGDDWLVGLAAGYELVSISTGYNAGTLKSNSGTISPYLGYSINDWLAADGTLGGTWIRYDYTRNSGANTGNSDAFRWFGSTNLTAFERLDSDNATLLKASLGYIRLFENQNSYTETGPDGNFVAASQVNFGQLRSTFRADRDFDADIGRITPNVSIRFEEDLPHPQRISLGNGLVSSDSRFGVTFGGGVNLLTVDGLLVTVSGTTTQFRKNTEIYGGGLNVRYNF